MLTVADALELDELVGARVVAGANGLGKSVTWLHVAGVPDAPAWLNGGELVLTTAINMPGDPAPVQPAAEHVASYGPVL